MFPKDVSYSFGGPKSSEYIVVEMHYDNPNMIAGRKLEQKYTCYIYIKC